MKNGFTRHGKQLWKCQGCQAQYSRRPTPMKPLRILYEEYTTGKQTLAQLAHKYGVTKKTIQRRLDSYVLTLTTQEFTHVSVVGVDCTFFGRGYGIILVRCPRHALNIYWKEITTESKYVYEEAKHYLLSVGINLKAVVIDAKHGIKEVFADSIVQICQFHQQQIVARYLTNNPRTEAGQVLLALTRQLHLLSEETFTTLLTQWYERYKALLHERTLNPVTGTKHYSHSRLRAAYRSLHTNLPYLFNFERYPELQIPNTNNSLEGTFSRMKQLLNNHHGLKQHRRYKFIQAFLNR